MNRLALGTVVLFLGVSLACSGVGEETPPPPAPTVAPVPPPVTAAVVPAPDPACCCEIFVPGSQPGEMPSPTAGQPASFVMTTVSACGAGKCLADTAPQCASKVAPAPEPAATEPRPRPRPTSGGVRATRDAPAPAPAPKGGKTKAGNGTSADRN